MALELQAALRRLRERRLKVTPQRRAILQVLLASREPRTARQVHDALQPSFPGLSLDTVYRNLNLLTQAGLAQQIHLHGTESARFEYQGDTHHHHLVCLGCGQSICVDLCPVDPRALEAARSRRFQVVGHAFELYGYCNACGARS